MKMKRTVKNPVSFVMNCTLNQNLEKFGYSVLTVTDGHTKLVAMQINMIKLLFVIFVLRQYEVVS